MSHDDRFTDRLKKTNMIFIQSSIIHRTEERRISLFRFGLPVVRIQMMQALKLKLEDKNVLRMLFFVLQSSLNVGEVMI